MGAKLARKRVDRRVTPLMRDDPDKMARRDETRRETSALVKGAMAADPQGASQALLNAGIETFCKNLLKAMEPVVSCRVCKQPQWRSWAFRTFAKASRLVGGEVQVATVFMNVIGAHPEEARKALAMYRRVEHVAGEGELIARLEEYMQDYYTRQGKRMVILDEGQRVVMDGGQ